MQFWNIKKGTSFSEAVGLYPDDRDFRHFYEFFMNYSPSGKKIILGEVNDNKYKIIEVPDTIVTQLYQDILRSYPAGLIVLQKLGLLTELRHLIIKKILAIYRS